MSLMMEKGATSQGCRRPPEARKDKGKDSPLQSPERDVDSANTFDFSPGDPLWTFDLQNYIRYFVLF